MRRDIFIGLARSHIKERWRERAWLQVECENHRELETEAVHCIAWLGLWCRHVISQRVAPSSPARRQSISKKCCKDTAEGLDLELLARSEASKRTCTSPLVPIVFNLRSSETTGVWPRRACFAHVETGGPSVLKQPKVVHGELAPLLLSFRRIDSRRRAPLKSILAASDPLQSFVAGASRKRADIADALLTLAPRPCAKSADESGPGQRA